MTATMTNGRPQRKQLIEQLDQQLDRHNAILNAFSEGLNGAVTDATKEGTKEAVTAAVIELLTNADLRVALHKASGPAPNAKPTPWMRMKAKVQQAVVKVKEVAERARKAVATRMEAVQSAMAGATAPAWFAWRLRKVALFGLGVGLAVAGVAYAGSHGLAAAMSGVGAAVTTVAIQAGLWVRKSVRRFALV